MQLLKSGNQNAYKALYDENRDAFLAFARKHRVTEDDAIDIYQEAHIVLYENIVNGKLTKLNSSLKTYVFSIGKYKIYERLRASKKLVLVDNEFQMNQWDEELEYDETTLNNQQKLLKEQLKNLGERCRNILELFYLDGLNIEEIRIKEKYGNANTVKAQKSRCLKQLKTLINSPKS